MGDYNFHFTYSQAIDLINSPYTMTDRVPMETFNYACASLKDSQTMYLDMPLTPQEARILEKQGDSALLAEIDPYSQKYSVKHEEIGSSNQLAYDVTGDYPDVGLFLQGEPEHMASFQNLPDKPVVNFLFSIGGLSYVNAQDFKRRGTALFELIRALELQNYSVGLTIGNRVSTEGTNTIQYLVTLKNPGEFFSPAIAAYWCAHGSSFRRSLWRVFEHLPDSVKRANRVITYGTSYGATIDMIPPNHRNDFIVFPSTRGRHDWSKEKWLSEGKKLLAEKGIVLK